MNTNIPTTGALNLSELNFVLGAAHKRQFPPDQGVEVAIIGRSNAGKSSLLNALANRKRLAKTSKIPGRTQQVNFFALDEYRRVADLPGYGYAKVPLSVKSSWMNLINQYLADRVSIRALILVMDIRRKYAAEEHQLIEWASEYGIEVLLVLSKCDKLSFSKIKQAELNLNASIVTPPSGLEIISCSSTKGTGVQIIKNKLYDYLQLAHKDVPK